MISSHDNTSLPLELRTNPLGLNITNTGTGAIRILDLMINERDDCSTTAVLEDRMNRKLDNRNLDKDYRHKIWVATGQTLIYARHTDRPEEIKPKELHVGDVGLWSTSCDVIVRVWVTTDKGSATYTFK
jgi:hypothetical protein